MPGSESLPPDYQKSPHHTNRPRYVDVHDQRIENHELGAGCGAGEAGGVFCEDPAVALL